MSECPACTDQHHRIIDTAQRSAVAINEMIAEVTDFCREKSIDENALEDMYSLQHFKMYAENIPSLVYAMSQDQISSQGASLLDTLDQQATTAKEMFDRIKSL